MADPNVSIRATPNREALEFPSLVARRGPIVGDTRNVSVLTAIENFMQYCYIPDRKVVASRQLLIQAWEFHDLWLWRTVLTQLQAETARKGYRSQQAVDVLIAEKREKARADALAMLEKMGPQPTPEAKA